VPTLNRTKDETKTIIKWFAIALGIIFLFSMGIKLLIFAKDLFIPPPPPTATFGKLPPIAFPNQAKRNITYSINTLTGYLPTLSDRAKVYKITNNPPTLLSLENARAKVVRVGFTSPGTQISEDTYQWTIQDAIQRKITMNIYSSNFKLSSSYLSAKTLGAYSGTDDANNAIKTAKSFLLNMYLFPSDIDESKTKITPYSIESNSLIPAEKITKAKIVKVDFFQKDMNNLPIYYEKGASTTFDFLVGKNGEQQILEATYIHKDISDVSSTYAIKTAQEAYSELQNGKVYIIDNDQNTANVTIKNVYLGYYIGEVDQNFLMPIIVFEGSNNFLAYVSAVRDEWIGN
jgi:hypothetical protein